MPAKGHICILGAGAIGGGIGALLHAAGHRTTLVARGAHLEAMRRDGLRLLTPDGSRTVAVPACDAVPDDASVVLLAVKSPQLPAAVSMIPSGRAVVCLQNGLDSARRVERAGHPAVAAMVYLPATHLVPGEVRLHGAPHPGVVDLGPGSPDAGPVARQVADALRSAGIDSVYRPDIMAWKRGKLLLNLAGGLALLNGEADPALHSRLMREATTIYAAHGLDWIPVETLRARAAVESRPAAGLPRAGNSMWQSHTRGRRLEVDAIYDALLALGRRAGIEAPACAALRDELLAIEPGGPPGGSLHPEPA